MSEYNEALPSVEEEVIPAVEEVVAVVEPVVEEVVVPSAPEPEVVFTPPAAPGAFGKSKNDEDAAAASSFEKVVLLSSLKFKAVSRRSLSVAYVQERLLDLGFGEAGSDKRGWLSDGTRKALNEFAGSDVVESGEVKDIAVIERLFAGTAVKVIY